MTSHKMFIYLFEKIVDVDAIWEVLGSGLGDKKLCFSKRFDVFQVLSKITEK